MHSMVLVCLTITGTASLLNCAVVLHSWLQLLQFHSENWFVSRWGDRSLLGWYGMCTSVYCLSRILVVYSALRVGTKQLDSLAGLDYAVRFFDIVLGMISFTGMVLVFVIRGWNHTFSANVAFQLGIQSWKSVISNTNEVNFYLRYKSTLGNWRFVLRIAVIIWFLCGLVVWYLSHFLGLGPVPMFGVIVVLSALFYVWTYLRYPVFQDGIRLRCEWRVIIKLALSIAPLWIFLTVLPMIMNWNWKSHRKELLVVWTIRQLYLGGSMTGMFYVTTMMVIKLFYQPSKVLTICERWEMPLSFEHSPSSISRSTLNLKNHIHSNSLRKRSNSATSHSTTELATVLGDNAAFRAFMGHLLAEFAAENAMCVIECVQFRNRMMEMEEQLGCDHEESDDFITELQLCEDILETRSTLVSRLTEVSMAREVASTLCQRYITDYSPYCINLGFRVRKQILNKVDSEKEIRFDVFDQVIRSCLRLLKESLSRFSRTEQWMSLNLANKT